MNVSFASIICLGFLLSGCSCSQSGADYDMTSMALGLMGKQFGLGNSTDMLKQLQQLAISFPSTFNISKQCQGEVTRLIGDILQQKLSDWIIYADAMGKPGSGIFAGNFFLLGSYGFCQNLTTAHYCTADADVMIPPLPFPVPSPVGICAPKMCSGNDIITILRNITHTYKISANLNFDNSRNKNQFGQDVICIDKKSYSAGNVFAIVVCTIIVVLCISSTAVDLYLDGGSDSKSNTDKSTASLPRSEVTDIGNQETIQEPNVSLLIDAPKPTGNTFLKFLFCFSMLRNSSILLNTTLPRGGIGSVNGIRAISMSWVILGHTYFFGFMSRTDNSALAVQVTKRFSFLAVSNAYVSVDTFFLLSGLLVSYLSLRRYRRKGSFPWFQYYIHRILRLTPVYMFVIFLYLYLYPLLGDGPMWHIQSEGVGVKNCKKYWWTNLLYINNFFPSPDQCIGWTWYLANDMQFYVITPIILLIMFNKKAIGALIVNGFFLIATFIITASIIAHYKFNTLLTSDFDDVTKLVQAGEFFEKVYQKPYCRIAPYIVGIVLGYLLESDTKPKSKSNKIIYTIGWVVATVVALLTIYGPWHAVKAGGTQFNMAENITYGTFSRFAWGCSVAWVIYACHNGYGGVVNRFLSWRGFIPLSRLTFCAYLVHPLVMDSYYGSLHTAYHYSDHSAVFLFFSFLSIAYSIAFALSLMVEYPLMNIEKLVFE